MCGICGDGVLQGGTFSVASVAEYGLKSCSSLIIPPQACIVTVGACKSPSPSVPFPRLQQGSLLMTDAEKACPFPALAYYSAPL